jgi:hypothetical protein
VMVMSGDGVTWLAEVRTVFEQSEVEEGCLFRLLPES